MRSVHWLSTMLVLIALAAVGELLTAQTPSMASTPLSQELDAQIKAYVDTTKREGGTHPEDWRYELTDGVMVSQVTFYSNEQPTYAKLFYPAGFSPNDSWPAVVLGHGYNALSIAIEKYGARFAERGLVAMVIDYRSYGFSDPWVRLLEPEAGLARQREVIKEVPIELERTRLVQRRQVEDIRAAISYLQGEPGVNPDQIGVWGSSYGGGVMLNVAGHDSRVKAVVGQVSGANGLTAKGPASISDELLQDQIRRARTGRGAEVIGGFSFRTLIGLEARFWEREARPGRSIERIPQTTAVLFILAENEELSDPHGPDGPFEAVKHLKGPAAVFEIPHVGHFQVYGGPPFEVSSNTAAEWFLHYLKGDTPVSEVAQP